MVKPAGFVLACCHVPSSLFAAHCIFAVLLLYVRCMSVACLLLDSGAGLGYVQVFLIMYAHCLWLAISVAG